MERRSTNDYQKLLASNSRRRKLRRMLALLCVFTILFTMDSLKMNAVTMEGATICGLDQHTHTAECYPFELSCGQQARDRVERTFHWYTGSFSSHTHTEDCLDDDGNLACGYIADAYFHEHNAYCYDQAGNLACGLQEFKPHEHTEDCYVEFTDLTCGLEENPGHVHTEDCYHDFTFLTCELEESEGHIHDSDCYAARTTAVCGLEENPGHVHTEACYTLVNLCGLEEDEEHQHTDECFESVLSCGLEEGDGAHTHVPSCYEVTYELVCGKAEGEGGHAHGEDCYTVRRELVCGKAEGEGAHHHDAGCITTTRELVCGQDAALFAAEQLGMESVVLHTHTPECFTEVERDGRIIRLATCGCWEIPSYASSEDSWTEQIDVIDFGHTHTAQCYTLSETPQCGKPEHVHTAACYGAEEPAETVSPVVEEITYNNEETAAETESDGAPETADESGLSAPGTTDEAVDSGETEPAGAAEAGDANGEVESAEETGTADDTETLDETEAADNSGESEETDRSGEIRESNEAEETGVSDEAEETDASEKADETEINGDSEESAEAEVADDSEKADDAEESDDAEAAGDSEKADDAEESDEAEAADDSEEADDADGAGEPEDDAIAIDALEADEIVRYDIALDFAGYDIDAENAVFIADADGAVRADLAALTSAGKDEEAEFDGVTVTCAFDADAAALDLAALSVAEPVRGVTVEDGALVAREDGEVRLVAEGVELTIRVTNLAEPEAVTELVGEGIVVTSLTGEGLPEGASAVFEPSGENFGALYALLRDREGDAPAEPEAPVLQIAPMAKKSMARLSAAKAPAAVEAVADEPLETDAEPARTEPERTMRMQLFNIGLTDAHGEEVEPGTRVHVRVDFDAPIEGQDFALFHVVDGEPVPVDGVVYDESGAAVGLEFDADSLSPFALTYYTVDFQYNVDGQEYAYQLVGGGAVTLTALLPALGVIDAASAAEFTARIAEATFSDPTLVLPVRLDADTTAGAYIDAHALPVVYSAELTADDIAALRDAPLSAREWALFALQSFDTRETLTVTMDDGEVFTVDVTDGRIERRYITADGQTYDITVLYDDDAQIPADADLSVREILPGSAEFADCLSAAAYEMGCRTSDVTFARFFDITIVRDGEIIEPETPVTVLIEYVDPLALGDEETLSVVHFAKTGAEVITDVSADPAEGRLAYVQSSFSVTGTVITGNPTANSQYMVLIKYEGKYYIVNNDGTLTEVPYENGTVVVDEPMMWTYDGSNIYHHAEQVDFNSSQVASDFYNKYIDPSDNGVSSGSVTSDGNGISTDHDNSGTTLNRKSEGVWDNEHWRWTQFYYNVIGNRPQKDVAKLTIQNNKIRSANNSNQYLGVVLEDGVPVSLKGGVSQAEAATVHLARAGQVLSTNYLNHTVNHIDISIEGKAAVDLPLAYGQYYDENGNPTLNVTENYKVHLESGVVGITLEDMKRSIITAYTKDKNTGEMKEVNNAFVISGYSANSPTAYSTQQVRIEGDFKVADMNPVSWQDYNNRKYQIWQERLDKRIYYTVTAYKPVEFTLYDPDYGVLCDEDGNPIKVTVDVAFSASFDYWNPDNECPPVRWDSDWLAGRGTICDHNLSGMDFVLGGNPDGNASLHAIEITKLIVDENGNRIALKKGIVQSFQEYYNKDLNSNGQYNADTALRNKDAIWNIGSDDYKAYDPTAPNSGYYPQKSINVKVGVDGTGTAYDYVDEGLYYITEDKGDIPDTIIDASDKLWTYDHTYILTENNKRGSYAGANNHDATPFHTTRDYTVEDKNGATEFASRAEALGKYRRDNDPNYNNQFLEFYVYNVYVSEKVDVPVEKTWPDFDDDNSIDWEATFVLQSAPVYADGRVGSFSDVKGKDAITLTKAQMNAMKPALVKWKNGQDLTEDEKNLLVGFKDLPLYSTGANGKAYRLQYRVRETGYTVKRGNEVLYSWNGTGDPDYVPITGHVAGDGSEDKKDYFTSVENVLSTDLDVRKAWSGAKLPDVDEVYVKIFRNYKEKASGDPEDFTAVIAEDVKTNNNAHGYLASADLSSIDTENGWLIIRRSGENAWENIVTLHNILGASEDLSSHYTTYTLKEVGYKDSTGTVHAESDVAGFKPTYVWNNDKTNTELAESDWKKDEDGDLTLSTEGKNHLKVVNKAGETTDYTVVKKFNGNQYPADNSVRIVVGLECSADGQKWETATSVVPQTVTLPLEKPADPADSDLTDAAWYASAEAWTYTWKDIDAKKDEQPLYYRAVEIETPGWFSASINAYEQAVVEKKEDGSNSTTIDAQKTEITNSPTTYTLDIDKHWTGRTGEDWPAGYTVDYQVVQNWRLMDANAENQLGPVFKSVDMDGMSGTLNARTKTAHFENLLSFGWLTATAGDVAAAAAVGVTLEEGKSYLVIYTYSVKETGVKWNNTPVDFRAQNVEGTLNPTTEGQTPNATAYAATLENEMTEITVRKQWKKAGGESVDETWPDGAVIDYRIMRVPVYTSANGRVVEFEAEEYLSKDKKVFDGDTRYVALTSANFQDGVKIEDLPAEGAVMLTGENAYGLEAGTYEVRYNYYVEEDATSVAPEDGIVYSPIIAEPGDDHVATLANEYTSLTVEKKWVKNGTDVEFPENFKVNWKVVRRASDGTVDDPYYVAYKAPTEGQTVAHDHRLEKGKARYTLNYLPTKGVRDGKEVTYTYEVYEYPTDSVSDNAGYVFQEIKADESGNNEFIITNDLTDVKVFKEWSGNAGTKVFVQLYSSVTDPRQSETVDVKVILDKWTPEGYEKQTEGTVTGKLVGRVGDVTVSSLDITLTNAANWTQIFSGLPKYDENNQLIVYSIVELSSVELQELSEYSVEGDTYIHHLQAKGTEPKKVKYDIHLIGDNPPVSTNWFGITVQVVKDDGSGGYDWGYPVLGNTTIRDLNDHAVTGELAKGGYCIQYWFNNAISGYTLDPSSYDHSGEYNNTTIYYIYRNGDEGLVDIPIKLNKELQANEKRVTIKVGNWKIEGSNVPYSGIPKGVSITVRLMGNNRTYTVELNENNGYSAEAIVEKDVGYQVQAVGTGVWQTCQFDYLQSNGTVSTGTVTLKKQEGNSGSMRIVFEAVGDVDSTSNWQVQLNNIQDTYQSNDTKSTVLQKSNQRYEITVDALKYGNPYYYRFHYSNANCNISITSDDVALSNVANENQVMRFEAKEGEVHIKVNINPASTQNAMPSRSKAAMKAAPALRAAEETTPSYTSAGETKKPPKVISVPEIETGSSGNATEHTIPIVDTSNLPENAVAIEGATAELYEGNNWSNGWDNLPSKDASGNPIYYYVVETAVYVTGDTIVSTTASYTRTVENGVTTIHIINETDSQEPPKGTLEIYKDLSGVTNPQWNRSFYFSLCNVTTGQYLGENGNSWEWMSGVQWIEITPLDEYVFTNLTPGNYVLKEKESSLELEPYVLSADSVTGTADSGISIAANAIRTFTFKNVYEPKKTSVTVTKTWDNADGSHEAPEGATVQFQLYRKEKNSGSDAVAVGDPITLDGSETPAWTAEWTDLRAYSDAEVEYEYTVKELPRGESGEFAWPAYTVSYPEKGTSAKHGETITNTEVTTSLQVTKQWKSKGEDRVFDGEKVIRFTLHQVYTDGNGEVHDAVYTAYGDNGVGVVKYTPGNPVAWETVTVDKLPFKVYVETDKKWYAVSYYVVEDTEGLGKVDVTYFTTKDTAKQNDGAKASLKAQGTDSGKITIVNEDRFVNLTVKKEWADLAKNVSYEIEFIIQTRESEAAEWSDYGESEAPRYTLIYDGATKSYSIKQGETVINASGNTINNLPVDMEYRVLEKKYTVKVDATTIVKELEAPGIAGTSVQDEEDETQWISELTNALDRLDIPGTKTWVDARQTHLPPTLTLKRRLLKDGTGEYEILRAAASRPSVFTHAGADPESEEETYVNLQPVWTGLNYKYSDLPKYDDQGREYEYVVTEDPIEGYSTESTNHVDDFGVDFINTEVGSVKVIKNWFAGLTAEQRQNLKIRYAFQVNDGTGWKDYDNVTTRELPLSADMVIAVSRNPGESEEAFAARVAKAEAGANGKTVVAQGKDESEEDFNLRVEDARWQQVFTNLPMYTADGTAIQYRVRETAIIDGSTTYPVNYDPADSLTGRYGDWHITNPEPGVLQGLTPVEFNIRNDKDFVSVSGKKTWVMKYFNGENLPALKFVLYEVGVDPETGEVLTNNEGQDQLTEIGTGEKKNGESVFAWYAEAYKDVKFQLNIPQATQGSDVQVATNVWSYAFTWLPKTRTEEKDGVTYTYPRRYRVKEIMVDGDGNTKFVATNDYSDGQPASDGSTINADFTNTEVAKVHVRKFWTVDGQEMDDPMGFVDSISFQLYRVGSAGKVESQGSFTMERKVDESNPGHYTWYWESGDLPSSYIEGNEIKPYEYYIVEDKSGLYYPVYITNGDEVYASTVPEGGQPSQETHSEFAQDAQAEAGGTIYLRNIMNTYELPSTGGEGTAIYTIGGVSILVLAAIWFVWDQRRRYHLIDD